MRTSKIVLHHAQLYFSPLDSKFHLISFDQMVKVPMVEINLCMMYGLSHLYTIE